MRRTAFLLLGAGLLASANALATGLPAITINAAGLSGHTRKMAGASAASTAPDSLVQAYVVESELVSRVQSAVDLKAEGYIRLIHVEGLTTGTDAAGGKRRLYDYHYFFVPDGARQQRLDALHAARAQRRQQRHPDKDAPPLPAKRYYRLRTLRLELRADATRPPLLSLAVPAPLLSLLFVGPLNVLGAFEAVMKSAGLHLMGQAEPLINAAPQP